MTFKEELERLLPKDAPCDIHETYDKCPIDQALTSIINLVDKELPTKKTIVLDRPLDIDDGEQFCVECGQWTYEGEIDCKCGGYNQAISDMRAKLKGDK